MFWLCPHFLFLEMSEFKVNSKSCCSKKARYQLATHLHILTGYIITLLLFCSIPFIQSNISAIILLTYKQPRSRSDKTVKSFCLWCSHVHLGVRETGNIKNTLRPEMELLDITKEWRLCPFWRISQKAMLYTEKIRTKNPQKEEHSSPFLNSILQNGKTRTENQTKTRV